DAPWTAEMAEEWDRVSAGVWVRENVRNPEARAVVMANLTTIFGLSPYAVSFLYLLWDSHMAGGVEKFGPMDGGSVQYRIRGGTQGIPLGIKQKMGDDAFILGSPVRELRQDGDGVTVVSERATLRCARVIVAIPTCLTGFIRYLPPLPADRAQLIQRVPQGSAMKVHLVYDRAFWRDAGLSGNSFAIDDSIVPQTLDAGGPAGQDEPGILALFLDDDGARDLGRLGQEERRALLIQDLVPRFGPQVLELSSTITPNYVELAAQELEWLRGDYASTPGPRVLTASGFGPAIRAPVGRIHWAGVDTATVWYQSIEGAAQSGERAAAEVVEAGLPPSSRANGS
ncbi:MAG: flavin monoamine oxidase family protein, partial [Longimicrobiaceae bacterium]